MQDNSQSSLVEEIKKEYGIGKGYIQAYTERWFKTKDVTEDQLNKVKNDPLLYTWFHFGLSTNQRGRLMAHTVQPYIPKHAQRYLDVGCGYGGFMVAFHEMGLDVNGFELDTNLIPLSQANLADHGVDPGTARVGNVLDTKFINQLGTFDVITCNDVIEHVGDVELALENMTRILNPSGILLMQMPNKDFVNFINNDSHYNLFGITLLRHAVAERYHHLMFGDEYTVGEYYEYGYYESSLKKLGCRVMPLPPLYPQKTKSEILQDFKETFKNLIRFWRRDDKPHAGIKLHVTILYLKYAATFLIKGTLSLLSKNGRDAFRRQYMTDFWFIMAVKN